MGVYCEGWKDVKEGERGRWGIPQVWMCAPSQEAPAGATHRGGVQRVFPGAPLCSTSYCLLYCISVYRTVHGCGRVCHQPCHQRANAQRRLHQSVSSAFTVYRNVSGPVEPVSPHQPRPRAVPFFAWGWHFCANLEASVCTQGLADSFAPRARRKCEMCDRFAGPSAPSSQPDHFSSLKEERVLASPEASPTMPSHQQRYAM